MEVCSIGEVPNLPNCQRRQPVGRIKQKSSTDHLRKGVPDMRDVQCTSLSAEGFLGSPAVWGSRCYSHDGEERRKGKERKRVGKAFIPADGTNFRCCSSKDGASFAARRGRNTCKAHRCRHDRCNLEVSLRFPRFLMIDYRFSTDHADKRELLRQQSPRYL